MRIKIYGIEVLPVVQRAAIDVKHQISIHESNSCELGEGGDLCVVSQLFLDQCDESLQERLYTRLINSPSVLIMSEEEPGQYDSWFFNYVLDEYSAEGYLKTIIDRHYLHLSDNLSLLVSSTESPEWLCDETSFEIVNTNTEEFEHKIFSYSGKNLIVDYSSIIGWKFDRLKSIINTAILHSLRLYVITPSRSFNSAPTQTVFAGDQVSGEFIQELEKTKLSLLPVMAGGENRLLEILDVVKRSEHFHRAIESTSQAFWVCDLSKNTVSMSPISRLMLGYTEDKQPATVDAWKALICEEQKGVFDEIIRTLESGDQLSVSKDIKFKSLNGDYVWIMLRATCVEFDDLGRPQIIVGTDANIDHRKQTELFIRKFKDVFNNVSHCISISDKNFVPIYINKAFKEKTGFNLEEVSLQNYTATISVDENLAQHIISVLLNGGGQWDGLTIRYDKDGNEFIAMNKFGVLRNKQGAVENVYSIFFDYSEELEKNQSLIDESKRLRTLNEEKIELLAGIGHDVKGYLNSIQGFAQLIELEMPSGEKLEEYTGRIINSSEGLEGLVNDVVQMGKDYFAPNINNEVIDLSKLFEELLEYESGRIKEKGLKVNFTLDTQLMAFSKRSKLKQIVMNLFGNAVKYNQPGGTIKINSKLGSGGKVIISIQDSGKGIDEESVHEIFEPFRRLNDNQSGYGIGLAFARRIAKSISAEIGVEIADEGGAVFTLTLPGGYL